jgi:hypothetical protein
MIMPAGDSNPSAAISRSINRRTSPIVSGAPSAPRTTVVVDPTCPDEIDRRLQHCARLAPDGAHALDFVRIFGQPRHRDNVPVEFGDDLQSIDLLRQARHKCEEGTCPDRPVNADPPPNAEIGKDAAALLHPRLQAVGKLLENLAYVPAVERHERQPGLFGFVLFPGTVQQHGGFATLFDDQSGNVSPADEVVVVGIGAL